MDGGHADSHVAVHRPGVRRGGVCDERVQAGGAAPGKSTLADPPVERVGLVGPGFYIRITPRKSWSWNMDGHPVGNTWYVARCAVHEPTTDEADR